MHNISVLRYSLLVIALGVMLALVSILLKALLAAFSVDLPEGLVGGVTVGGGIAFTLN